LDLCVLVGRIVADLQPTLTQHTLMLSDPGRSFYISGDALRLEHVVQNFLQNAITYSPPGGLITVLLEQCGQMACVAITDQGTGIPEEALPRRFQRFYRATNVDVGGIGGLGIGLYVVKELVSLDGGTVNVTSTEDQGSTFTVCLPLDASSEQTGS
jgi:signal transduction histidine kinase